MKNQVNTTTTAQDLYATAEKAVYIALRARHEKSGLQFLAELQNAQAQDRTARNAPALAEQIAELEKAHESHRKGAEHFQRIANRLTVTPAERATAQSLADEFSTKARAEQCAINDLCDRLSITYTDRADLTQTAILQIYENAQNPAPITARILASYGAECIEDLTETEREDAQTRANFKAVVNAVGRAISTIATPEALNRTTTKKTPATAEEVAEWCKKYGGTGADVKIPVSVKRCRASDCFDTMEYIEGKTVRGWYRIRHYKTTAPYQYIDNYTEDENGETDPAYLKTYNPFVNTFADLERIEELATRAELTERQRAFLEHFARRCRVEGDFKKCKEYAFAQIGITTDTNKSTFFNRLKKALATATK